MTVLICFLEIKRLVWKPVIIKVDVPGGLGSRGQRLRPLAGHFLAWGDINWPWGRQPASTPGSASLLRGPLPKAPTQRLLPPREGPSQSWLPRFRDWATLVGLIACISTFPSSLSFLSTPTLKVLLRHFFWWQWGRGGTECMGKEVAREIEMSISASPSNWIIPALGYWNAFYFLRVKQSREKFCLPCPHPPWFEGEWVENSCPQTSDCWGRGGRSGKRVSTVFWAGQLMGTRLLAVEEMLVFLTPCLSYSPSFLSWLG